MNMKIEKVTFKNKNGDQLVGRLQFPMSQHPKAYAIFAHCFTCGKNLKVVREISSAIAELGIAVLRFDFTGLGQSDGEFEDTNFSHDVEDLIQASNFLEKEYEAPSLLIGHSLGGTASLFAAEKLDNIKAIVTIASPSQPSHVQNLIQKNSNSNEENGDVKVNLGGKDFTIKKHFLEDINSKDTKSLLKNLNIPFLIMHSPEDKIVVADNTEELYNWANHPKSFISLNEADHLLNENIDASYIGNLIGHWATNYLDISINKNLAMDSESQSAAILKNEDKFTTHLKVGDFAFLGDEPEDKGGDNLGPAPYDFLTAGLAECTAMTLHVYARHKEWDLEEVRVHVNHEKRKVKDDEGKTTKKDFFNKKIKIIGNLEQSQIERLMEIGDRCPVHRTLHSDIEITSELINQK